MILDKELIFSEGQSLSAAGPSTNVVDQGAAGDAYVALWLVVNAADVTGTLGFDLETDSAEAFSSAETLLSVTAAERAEDGAIFKGRVPRGAKKYLRVKYTGTVTAATVTAFLTKDVSI